MTAADKVRDAVARLERMSPNPSRRQTVKDQIRAMLPAIEAARLKGMLWKEIHSEIVAAGIPIDPQVLANYICALRRAALAASVNDGADAEGASRDGVVVRLPRRGRPTPGNSPQRTGARLGKPLRQSEPTATEGKPSPPDDGTTPNSGAQPEQYVETPHGDRPTKVNRPK